MNNIEIRRSEDGAYRYWIDGKSTIWLGGFRTYQDALDHARRNGGIRDEETE